MIIFDEEVKSERSYLIVLIILVAVTKNEVIVIVAPCVIIPRLYIKRTV